MGTTQIYTSSVCTMLRITICQLLICSSKKKQDVVWIKELGTCRACVASPELPLSASLQYLKRPQSCQPDKTNLLHVTRRLWTGQSCSISSLDLTKWQPSARDIGAAIKQGRQARQTEASVCMCYFSQTLVSPSRCPQPVAADTGS